MYSLPKDIELELQRKFPDTHVTSIIDKLFQTMIDKIFDDGYCLIRRFGKFYAFNTFSSRKGKQVVRFKFKPSSTLLQIMNEDEYLIKNIPVKIKNVYDEKNESRCKLFREQKLENIKAASLSRANSDKKTSEKITMNKIIEFIDGEKKVE